MNTKTINNKFKLSNKLTAFTLLEILISLLILGGSLGIFFSSFQIIENIKQNLKLELEAYLIAERELELAKSDLNKNPNSLKNFHSKMKIKAKFSNPKFKTEIKLVKNNKIENLYKITVIVTNIDKSITATLQSHIFLRNTQLAN